MKSAYRLFRKRKKYYYTVNNKTGIQKSLGTEDSLKPADETSFGLAEAFLLCYSDSVPEAPGILHAP
jgi:hypothetical protein